MAIKELFYDNRPQVLLDPRASQRIDPRFTFTRASAATFVTEDGYVAKVENNVPRFDYDLSTGKRTGLVVEKSVTNLCTYSEDFANGRPDAGYGVKPSVTTDAITAPDKTLTADMLTTIATTQDNRLYNSPTVESGKIYTYSVFVKKGTKDSITVSIGYGGIASGFLDFNFLTETATSSGGSYIAGSGGYQKLANGWYRIFLSAKTFVAGSMGAGFLFGSTAGNTVYVWGAQLEEARNPYAPTSYIPTSSSAATRSQDLLSINNTGLPYSGSVYIDSRALSAEVNDTLISLKNSSNDKIDLAYLSNTDTYNSLALIANYDGNSKTSLPLPVPTTDRERNIITWGAQNYQYGRDSSRFATSLSSSVPTGLNQLSIGHDAVDPTKAFNGYINTVYAWSGELTPAVAEALVRNEIEAINADTYSPVGPAGSLALVINTQGATTSGDKTFTLPAESAATDNDIVITWGDGTESGLDGADAEVGASGLTHTYPAAGIYPVWVEGQMENIQFNNIANANDLLQIAAWGTGDMFTSPSTMQNAFYGCTQMDFSSSARTTNRPDTSAVTDWYRAFRDCSSITGTFPAFNFSAATNFQEAWQGCSSMTSFVAAGDQTQNVTNFSSAWYNCTSLTSFPLINTSSGTSFNYAWYNCTSLTNFPLINTAAGTNFFGAWRDCSGLTSFPLINTAAGTNFDSAWYNCSSLTSFPLINTAAGTNFNGTWYNCSSLTNFPLIDTSAGTNFGGTWRDCSSLTNFPLINTSAGTTFTNTWFGCTGLTTFPLINTSAGTNFFRAWRNCSSLTNFPLIDTSAGTNFDSAWNSCSSLTNFPLINTSAGTNFTNTWLNCSSLTDFPLIDTAAGTNFNRAWSDCSSLTNFPLIDTSAGVTFIETWENCSSLAGFPSINISAGTHFLEAWRNCSSLTAFPANFFDSWSGTPSDGCFYRTWDGCSSLTPASVVNILDSIAASGQSAPSGTDTGDKEITIDWDGTGDPATDAAAAITTLKSRNWDVVLNGVSQ